MLDSDEIEQYVNQLDNEVKKIRKESLKLTWAMRGGIQYHDILNLSMDERLMIAEISNENLEITQKSGLPYF
jgi:hypothetical protein